MTPECFFCFFVQPHPGRRPFSNLSIQVSGWGTRKLPSFLSISPSQVIPSSFSPPLIPPSTFPVGVASNFKSWLQRTPQLWYPPKLDRSQGKHFRHHTRAGVSLLSLMQAKSWPSQKNIFYCKLDKFSFLWERFSWRNVKVLFTGRAFMSFHLFLLLFFRLYRIKHTFGDMEEWKYSKQRGLKHIRLIVDNAHITKMRLGLCLVRSPPCTWTKNSKWYVWRA